MAVLRFIKRSGKLKQTPQNASIKADIMKKIRKFSPLLALALLAMLTWAAQSHLNRLHLFKEPEAIATVQAVVTAATVPVIQKGESVANLRARVEMAYEVADKQYGRVVMQDLAKYPAPKEGEAILLTYLKNDPAQALLPHEFASVDSQIEGIQLIVVLLGMATLLVPFMLIGYSRK